mmetsp:Transcript_39761/g.92124  ORF Transcript_39761/g.92124 Transcript_39761/m.92124 type:complete len:203 (-) Transcript_39761:745-1353(-)
MPPRRGRADRLGRRHRGQRVHYIRPDHLRSGRRGRGGGGGLGTDGRTRGDVMAGERRARRLAPADTHRAQNVRGLRRARAAPQAGELHRAGPPLHAPQAGSAREAVARNAGRGRPAERAKNQQGDFGNSHGSGAGHPAAHHSDGRWHGSLPARARRLGDWAQPAPNVRGGVRVRIGRGGGGENQPGTNLSLCRHRDGQLAAG